MPKKQPLDPALLNVVRAIARQQAKIDHNVEHVRPQIRQSLAKLRVAEQNRDFKSAASTLLEVAAVTSWAPLLCRVAECFKACQRAEAPDVKKRDLTRALQRLQSFNKYLAWIAEPADNPRDQMMAGLMSVLLD